jgi:hypothetical protein
VQSATSSAAGGNGEKATSQGSAERANARAASRYLQSLPQVVTADVPNQQRKVSQTLLTSCECGMIVREADDHGHLSSNQPPIKISKCKLAMGPINTPVGRRPRPVMIRLGSRRVASIKTQKRDENTTVSANTVATRLTKLGVWCPAVKLLCREPGSRAMYRTLYKG